MENIYIVILALIVGIINFFFGSIALFSKNGLRKLENTLWKNDGSVISDKTAKSINHARSISYFAIGIVLIAGSLWILLFKL